MGVWGRSPQPPEAKRVRIPRRFGAFNNFFQKKYVILDIFKSNATFTLSGFANQKRNLMMRLGARTPTCSLATPLGSPVPSRKRL